MDGQAFLAAAGFGSSFRGCGVRFEPRGLDRFVEVDGALGRGHGGGGEWVSQMAIYYRSGSVKQVAVAAYSTSCWLSQRS